MKYLKFVLDANLAREVASLCLKVALIITLQLWCQIPPSGNFLQGLFVYKLSLIRRSLNSKKVLLLVPFRNYQLLPSYAGNKFRESREPIQS